MGVLALKGLVQKTKLVEKGVAVDSVFMGSAIGATSALNGSRWCVLGSGLPISTAASYVEMQCGSAIDSINHAAWRILANQADVVIAGGFESYSQATCKFSMSSEPFRMIPPMPIMPSLSRPKNPQHRTWD